MKKGRTIAKFLKIDFVIKLKIANSEFDVVPEKHKILADCGKLGKGYIHFIRFCIAKNTKWN